MSCICCSRGADTFDVAPDSATIAFSNRPGPDFDASGDTLAQNQSYWPALGLETVAEGVAATAGFATTAGSGRLICTLTRFRAPDLGGFTNFGLKSLNAGGDSAQTGVFKDVKDMTAPIANTKNLDFMGPALIF
jgi:hypothetical protein